MKTIAEIKNTKTVIQCKTQEEWDIVTKLLNYNWTVNDLWNREGINTIIYASHQIRGSIKSGNYKDIRHTLIQATDIKEVIKQLNRIINNFKID